MSEETAANKWPPLLRPIPSCDGCEQRLADLPRFRPGDTITLYGTEFIITEVAGDRLVLRAVPKRSLTR